MWNWAHFVDLETGKEFSFTTTHFDNNSPCQELSAPLVLERTSPWNSAMPGLFLFIYLLFCSYILWILSILYI